MFLPKRALISAMMLLAIHARSAFALENPAASANESSGSLLRRPMLLEPEFSVNALQPLNIGVWIHPVGEAHWSAFADLGFLWLPFGRYSSGPGSSAEAFGIHAGVRYRPREELPYFGSVSLGYRYLGASINESGFSPINTTNPIDLAQASLSTVYGQLSVGCNWDLNHWLEIGFDVGAQFPLIGWGSFSVRNTATNADSSNTSSLAIDSSPLSKVAGIILPEITLIRLTMKMP